MKLKKTKKETDKEFFIKRRLFKFEPKTKDELWHWARVHLGLTLTREAVCEDHHSQLDWLWHSTRQMGTSYGLACRNGGKTSLGAAATIYDCQYHAPCSTIIVAGCLHPATPVLTLRGFKPICEVNAKDYVYDGNEWRKVKALLRHPSPKSALQVSFIGLPPLFITPEQKLIRVEGIDCPLAPKKPMITPRVCAPDVNCPYHRRSFKCKGRGRVGEVQAQDLKIGDALVYPLTYLSTKNEKSMSSRPFLEGILYGSVTSSSKGYLKISKPYSQSREYDRFVLDRIREAISKELGAMPLRQYSCRYSFNLEYDAGFFRNLSLDTLPKDFFRWDKSQRNEFITGIFNGSRFAIYNGKSGSKAFASRRDTRFALNLFSMLANASPGIDTDKKFETRLTFAAASVKTIQNLVPPRLCMASPDRKRASTQPIINFSKWGKSACTKIKNIKKHIPTEDYYDLEVEGGERFLTLWGIVHNSKRQSERMYGYTRPMFSAGSRGILQDQTTLVGRELTKLKNGSTIEIVASTELSVGGFHQDRIKVDQVDDMKPSVWDTLQFDLNLASEKAVQIETLGTWDRVGGLYERVLRNAKKHGKPIFKWCLLDVMEPCKDRSCRLCDLSDVCGGIAKDKHEGFLRIDKAIEIRHNLIADEFFFVQMMLKEPRPLDALIPEFHDGAPYVRHLKYNPSLPTYRTFDWGTRGNFVCLWIQVDEVNNRLLIIDEYVGGKGAFPSREAKTILAFEGKRGYKNIHGGYGDPHGPAWIREFELFGIYVIPLVRRKADRIAMFGKLLAIREDNTPSIIIGHLCKNLRHQLLTYDARCLFDQKGHPADDSVDAMLYGINGLKGVIRLSDDFISGGIAHSADKKKAQRDARNRKFSPEVAELLGIGKGKTDFRKLLR